VARRNWLGVVFVAASVACGGTTVQGGSSSTSGGGQVTLPAGAPCSANAQCNSQICGLDGTGNCCSAQCTAGSSVCGIAACDATGACIKAYAGTSCDSCSGNTLTAGVCDGNGTCESGIANACPGNLICNAAETGCDTKCSVTSDCAAGSYCNAGTCGPKIAIGACTTNDSCTSGVCGISGSGHCCSSACSSTTAPCGATDCDPLGGTCVFAAQGVTCGSTQQSCTGNIQSNATVCDGLGNCPTPGTTDCSPFLCGASACLTDCSDATSCGTGDFCDLTHAACCAPLATGATLTVDSVLGSDELGCCGIGGNQPCQTLTHAMKLIDMTQAANVTILATAGLDGGGDWSAPGEKYPIVLGWGVELKAPGVHFFDPPPGGMGALGTFLIESYSEKDTVGYVSIVGSSAEQVGVGMSSVGTESLAYSAIQINAAQTLYIANAYVNGSATAQTNAFTVMPGGSLVLGQDQAAGVTGTVNIGNGMNNQPTDGYNGIFCKSDNVGKGCTVTDSPLVAPPQSSVVIRGQYGADIIAQDFANISLSSTPTFGITPPSLAFGECNNDKPDCEDLKYPGAIYLDGKVSMTLRNGAIHCISADGIAMASSAHGTPTLTLDSTTIRNTETALQVSAGTANVWSSTFEFNFNGVIQAAGAFGAPGGTVNLNGGLDGGTDGGTTVICSSNTESIYTPGGLMGVNVLNQSPTPLIATNVSWDTPQPDHFACKTNLASCICSLDAGSCVNTPGGDGMDAVTESTGPVVTNGNSQSQLAVQRSCQHQ